MPWTFDFSAGASGGLTRDPAKVHGGAQALELTLNQVCGYPALRFSVGVPHPDANGGPALKAWFQANTAFQVRVPSVDLSLWLPATSGWEQRTICLPPERAGGVNMLLLSLEAFNGSCGDPVGPFSLLVDDLSVGTDPSCPAQ